MNYKTMSDEEELAAFNRACDAELMTGTLIDDLGKMVEKYDIRQEVIAIIELIEDGGVLFGDCEYVMGQTHDGGGEPCRKMGIYRESCEIILCDRHAKEMQ